ncbi:MAG: EF-P lysine aminoacylase GenX [Lentisphaeria bacterium]|nr:EF-P lysine aminoacylase GenX [Lentisphaeria bacterium]
MNKKNDILKKRALIYRAIRHFFDERDFIEVTTPTALKEAAPEEFIESIFCDNNKLLRCSPELAMKRLLCSGMDKIYQIGPCFRADEHGSRHREEFTMLEYYQSGIDYMQMLRLTAEMVQSAGKIIRKDLNFEFKGNKFSLAVEPEIITVKEAFLKYTQKTAEQADIDGDFDELMVCSIEPNLGKSRMTFLTDYPANRASLSRLKKSDPSVAERFELYIEGIELANAFGELTDAAIQQERFESAMKFRAENNMKKYPPTTEFFKALQHGMPESSGSALGVDRLIMLLTDTPDIGGVIIED